MIRYTVVWHENAQDELARLWMEASDRRAITAAADVIDKHLSGDAPDRGAVAEGSTRVLIVPPLRVLFFVSELDRIAKVGRVTRA